MDTAALERMGLTRNEAILYVSLLRLGLTGAQSIVKESELHRSRVYDGLESLQRKGLVTHVIKDRKKHFQAVEPENLLHYIEEQKEAVKELLPELRKIQGSRREEITASIYKGKEGLKAIHADMLREGKDIRVLGAKGHIFSRLRYFMPGFERERMRKNMRWICLWDSEKAEMMQKLEGKVLPKNCASRGVVNIYGRKVAIVLWKEQYPTGFVIDDRDIADAFRGWFDLLMDSC